MKTLIFTQYFWPESFRINDVAKTLIEKGVEVEILTGKPNYPEGAIYPSYNAWGFQKEVQFDLTINRIPLLARGKGALRLMFNYLSFIISGMLFAPWVLRKKKYDLIFVYAPSPILQALPALFLGKLKGIPVVIWVQDLWPESLSATGFVKNKHILKLVEYVVGFIYRHADLLLVQSKAFMKPVRLLAESTPVEYYPNTVGETFSVRTTTEVPDVPGLDGGFPVMFAGNIGTAQAVEVIVEAATLLSGIPDINFVVLGDGSRRDWMLQEMGARGLKNIHLPGKFAIETMPGFMQKASVLLVTLANKEIFGLTIPSKIQAYLAAGKPVLACLNGEGARLVLDAKAGLAVPAGNPKALADAVLQLYKASSQERDIMGDNGRLYYEQHFSHDILIDQLISYFQTICNKTEEKIE